MGTSLLSALFPFENIFYFLLPGAVFSVFRRIEIVLQAAKLSPMETSDFPLMLVCGISNALGVLDVSVFLLTIDVFAVSVFLFPSV
jgi:hypothetical protein